MESGKSSMGKVWQRNVDFKPNFTQMETYKGNWGAMWGTHLHSLCTSVQPINRTNDFSRRQAPCSIVHPSISLSITFTWKDRYLLFNQIIVPGATLLLVRRDNLICNKGTNFPAGKTESSHVSLGNRTSQ